MGSQQIPLIENLYLNSTEGILITDENYIALNCNSSFTKITGYQPRELINKKLDIFNLQNQSLKTNEILESLKSKGFWRGEYINLTKNNEPFRQATTIRGIYDAIAKRYFYLFCIDDITRFKTLSPEQNKLRLADKEEIEQAIDFHIEANKTKTNNGFSIITFDIDHFKYINDALSYAIGDQLLSLIESDLIVFKISNPEVLTVGRTGGDQFSILVKHDKNEKLEHIIEKLNHIFNKAFMIKHQMPLFISVSIGVAMYPCDGHNGNVLLNNANSAMFLAKDNGRHGVAYYTKDLSVESTNYIRLQSALHQAISENQFYLVYQPQFHFNKNKAVAFEALIRWQHPELGSISPAQFIPIAEKNGFIQQIDLWVIETACAQAKQWLDSGKQFNYVSVNVSAVQFLHDGFVGVLQKILTKTGLASNKLQLEITEGVLLSDAPKAKDILSKIQAVGVSIALDDFGTGYSSLAYLKGLPINTLKIDQSFITELGIDKESSAIVDAIYSLCEALSLEIVAEGVETEKQVNYLKNLGDITMQGYFYSKPVPPELASLCMNCTGNKALN